MSEQLSVEFIMEDDLFAVSKEGTLEDAMFAMFVNRFRRLLVEEDGDIIGIITASDILAAIQSSGKPTFLKTPIKQYMTDKLITVDTTTSVLETAKTMQEMMISSVLVQDRFDKYVGIVTEKDICYYDVLWQNIEHLEIDTSWKFEPIVEINEDYSWWQAVDKFLEGDRRELVVKNSETNDYEGVITKMDILKAVNLHADDIREDNLFLQLSPIESLYNRHFIFLELPTTIKRCRRLMNLRGLSSIPLFEEGELVKIMNEALMLNSYVLLSETTPE